MRLFTILSMLVLPGILAAEGATTVDNPAQGIEDFIGGQG